jgi:FlaA1/EpsC-like NDP-sugar epimerase
MSAKGGNVRTILILVGDILIIPFSYVAGYYLRFGNLFGFREKLALWFIPLIVLSYLAIFHFFDLYRLSKNYFTINSFLTIFLSVALAAVCVSFLNYAIFLFPYLIYFCFSWLLFGEVFAINYLNI